MNCNDAGEDGSVAGVSITRPVRALGAASRPRVGIGHDNPPLRARLEGGETHEVSRPIHIPMANPPWLRRRLGARLGSRRGEWLGPMAQRPVRARHRPARFRRCSSFPRALAGNRIAGTRLAILSRKPKEVTAAATGRGTRRAFFLTWTVNVLVNGIADMCCAICRWRFPLRTTPGDARSPRHRGREIRSCADRKDGCGPHATDPVEAR